MSAPDPPPQSTQAGKPALTGAPRPFPEPATRTAVSVAAVQWDRVKAIFEQAATLAPRHREAYLDAVCATEPELRAEVDSLLATTDEFGSFPLSVRVRPPTPPTAARTASIGEGEHIAGRFHVRRFVGRGGMGEVYEADDQLSGVRVALKVVRPDLGGDARIRDLFRSELQVARQITHPNVCRIHELFAADGASAGGVVVIS